MERKYTARIYELYDNYAYWSLSFQQSHGGLKSQRRFLTGNSEYNRQENHKVFFNECGTVVDEYLETVRSGEGREELLPLLNYVLIECHYDMDPGTEWMLLAMEKRFIPFLEFIGSAGAKYLYEPYRALRRKNRGLPPQDEILKILKKLHK